MRLKNLKLNLLLVGILSGNGVLLAGCNSGANSVNSSSSTAGVEYDLVSVAEVDDIASSSGPLTAAQVYSIDPTAVDKTFAADPDADSQAELIAIHDSARKISVEEKEKLHAEFAAKALTPANYTYLYCYATAWLNTKDGARVSLNGASQPNLHLSGFASNGKILIQEPTHPLLLPTTFGMVYFVKDPISSLQKNCKDSLTNLATSLLKRNYPSYSINDVTIDNVSIRGRNNALAFDHPLLPLNASIGDNKIHSMVSFGDSLSDTGATSNMLLHIIPQRNTWFAGHFSNGWTWAEYAANKANFIPYNQAWGAAGVNNQPVINLYPWTVSLSYAAGFIFPSIYEQNTYYNSYVEMNAPRNPDETIYTLLIGGNDFVNYNEDSQTVLDKVGSTLNYLVNINHAKNILVFNLPDLTVAPIFKVTKSAIKSQVAEKTQAYNSGLPAIISYYQAQYPNIKIKMFDTKGLFDRLLQSPTTYGFTNVQDTCLQNPDNNYVFATTRKAGCNGYNYMFWDNLHPTTAVHKVLGEAVADFVQNNY